MRHYANRRECVCACVCTVQKHTQKEDRDTKYVNMEVWVDGGLGRWEAR